MRTVFFGTPGWAVPPLRALLASDIEVAGVVTNPDRPSGRGMKLHAPPVKDIALEAGIEVLQPERARDPAVAEWLAGKAVDVATVVAYGKILPGSLLDVPPFGFVNVHFSLLPHYRGAAPVQRAIMNGDPATGVAIMVLTEGMDEGPVVATEQVAIEPDETAGELGMRLAHLSGPLLVTSLEALVGGEIVPRPQDDDAATYAGKIDESEARIDWGMTARRIHDHVRGLNPAPGAWTTLDGRRVKIHRTAPGDPSNLGPGEIAADGSAAGTGDGTVALLEVQMEGRKRMTGSDLAHGLRLRGGAAFV